MPLLAVLVTAVLSIAICSAWLNWSRRVAMLRERQDEVARVLGEATFPLTAQVLQQMTRLSGQQFVVWDSEQVRIVESSFDKTPTALDRLIAATQPPLDSGHLTGFIECAGDTYSVRVTQLKRHPRLQVLILTSRRSLAEAQWDVLWPPLAVGSGALLLLVPWLLALTKGWSRRIESIQRSVANIARGDLTSVPDIFARDDELSALVADIHRMSHRLQELQTELIQSERERLVAQLAAGFAHQFRNGVAGASLALQLHASRCSTSSDRSLDVAQRQLGLLETEIRGMLSLAKRSKGPYELLCISELIGQALDLVSPAVEHHGIKLQNDSDKSHVELEGSRDGLRAALLNLLLNAVDAAGPTGEIRVAARSAGAGVAIVVKDNGAGPNPDVAHRMTEAFVTTKPEGIGLGLTVVATVVHDHGGHLNWSRDDGWTAVELWLPTKPQTSRALNESGLGR